MPEITPRSILKLIILGGKGSPTHEVAVIGDTVSDPLNNTVSHHSTH